MWRVLVVTRYQNPDGRVATVYITLSNDSWKRSDYVLVFFIIQEMLPIK